VRDGGSSFPPSRSVVINLLNEKHDRGNPAMTWTLTNAWPTKITGPTMNAKGNDFAVEQVDLAHERLDIS
jgi:phage tail-like protein